MPANLEHVTETFVETQELLRRLFVVLSTHGSPHQSQALDTLWQDYTQVIQKVDQEYANA